MEGTSKGCNLGERSTLASMSGTRTASSSASDLRPLHPRVRQVWWATGALAFVLATLAAAAFEFFVVRRFLGLPRFLVLGLVVALAATLAVTVPVLRYRRWRYALREEDLWIQRGILVVRITVIPYSRLQYVDTRQGPLDRLLGLAQLVVHTAAAGVSGRVPGLLTHEAEGLRDRLAKLDPDAAGV